MNFFLLILTSLFVSGQAFGDVSAISYSGKVRSFDKKNVVVESEGKLYKVARTAIKEKTLQPGQTVVVSLTGKEAAEALATPKK